MPPKQVFVDTTAPDYDVEEAVLRDADLELSTTFLQTRDPTEFLDQIVDADAIVMSLAPMTREVIGRLRRIAGAALDIVEQEPLPAGDPLRRLDNVILTPHSAHWSIESGFECRRTAVEHVLTFLRGQIPPDVVNRAVLERDASRSGAS